MPWLKMAITTSMNEKKGKKITLSELFFFFFPDYFFPFFSYDFRFGMAIITHARADRRTIWRQRPILTIEEVFFFFHLEGKKKKERKSLPRNLSTSLLSPLKNYRRLSWLAGWLAAVWLLQKKAKKEGKNKSESERRWYNRINGSNISIGGSLFC